MSQESLPNAAAKASAPLISSLGLHFLAPPPRASIPSMSSPDPLYEIFIIIFKTWVHAERSLEY